MEKLLIFFLLLTSVMSAEEGRIWDRGNLIPWEVAPRDTSQRSPEERALMLKKAGIHYYAYIAGTKQDGSRGDVNLSLIHI